MASPQWLTRTAELEAVRRQGKRHRTGALEVRFLASLLRHPRVGIIVPRHQQTAVARNRLKRRLRELARQNLYPVLQPLAPLDVVVRAAPAAYAADFAKLASDVDRLGARISGEMTE
ncbi:MAG: ribonuclease P protein component [Gemmatimonadaceae bacterium]